MIHNKRAFFDINWLPILVHKTIEERLAASINRIEAIFIKKDFVKQKIDQQIISSYKIFS